MRFFIAPYTFSWCGLPVTRPYLFANGHPITSVDALSPLEARQLAEALTEREVSEASGRFKVIGHSPVSAVVDIVIEGVSEAVADVAVELLRLEGWGVSRSVV